MDCAVRPKIYPACSSDVTKNLREPLASIEWLVVLAVWMTELRVEFVQPHEIGVVGSRQEEFSAGPGDSVHLGESTLDIRQVFDRLARNQEIEGVIGEWQILCVGLNERGGLSDFGL